MGKGSWHVSSCLVPGYRTPVDPTVVYLPRGSNRQLVDHPRRHALPEPPRPRNSPAHGAWPTGRAGTAPPRRISWPSSQLQGNPRRKGQRPTVQPSRVAAVATGKAPVAMEPAPLHPSGSTLSQRPAVVQHVNSPRPPCPPQRPLPSQPSTGTGAGATTPRRRTASSFRLRSGSQFNTSGSSFAQVADQPRAVPTLPSIPTLKTWRPEQAASGFEYCTARPYPFSSQHLGVGPCMRTSMLHFGHLAAMLRLI
eukprot:SAG31_NODE_3409_length_4306_cov_1.917281_6_plen_252_part_00